MITPQEAVAAINKRFGSHPGYRALHAKGQFCKGSFTATPAAAALTRALPFQGEPVPATIRFSNGGGDPTVADFLPDVRGLAVSLHLPDGKRTDIVAQSAPRFPVRSADAFIEFMRAMQPGLAQLWKMPAFLLRHPESLGALAASGPALAKPPASYTSLPYYAVHGFRWTAANGSQRWVRYRWLPDTEVRLGLGEAKKKGPDYLQQELRSRLQSGPARMHLHLQIAGPDDNPDDPLIPWDGTREDIIAGTLEISALDEARETDGKPFVFDPVRVVDGIGLSNDPVLNYRTHAYTVSVDKRAGKP
jgi:catalase